MHTGPINQSMICPTYNYSYKDDEWMGAGPSGIEVSDVEAKVIINDEAESEDKEGEQGPQGEDSEQEPQEEEGDQGPQMENPTDDDYKVF